MNNIVESRFCSLDNPAAPLSEVYPGQIGSTKLCTLHFVQGKISTRFPALCPRFRQAGNGLSNAGLSTQPIETPPGFLLLILSNLYAAGMIDKAPPSSRVTVSYSAVPSTFHSEVDQ